MFYVYILQSELDKSIYIGFTSDLRRRAKEHKEGKSRSTRHMLPIKLVYYEAFISKALAQSREIRLKQSGRALAQLKKRVGI